MKHLKLWEEYSELDYLDILNPNPEFEPKYKGKLDPDELEDFLSKLFKSNFSFNDFLNVTKKLLNFRDKYPYIRTDNPYNSIYWKYAKMWYNEAKEYASNPERKKKIEEITGFKIDNINPYQYRDR